MEIAEMNKRDEEIMKEIQRIQTERLRNEKLRQSIRENSVELRDLEQKLNYAYMNKERALQITEKQLLLKQEKVCDYLVYIFCYLYDSSDLDFHSRLSQRILGFTLA